MEKYSFRPVVIVRVLLAVVKVIWTRQSKVRALSVQENKGPSRELNPGPPPNMAPMAAP